MAERVWDRLYGEKFSYAFTSKNNVINTNNNYYVLKTKYIGITGGCIVLKQTLASTRFLYCNCYSEKCSEGNSLSPVIYFYDKGYFYLLKSCFDSNTCTTDYESSSAFIHTSEFGSAEENSFYNITGARFCAPLTFYSFSSIYTNVNSCSASSCHSYQDCCYHFSHCKLKYCNARQLIMA